MRGVNVVVVAVAALTISCDDGAVGKQCQPGDTAFCGDGYQCLSFCDKA